MRLAVALADAGAHPAAWREPGARADELFGARYWIDQVREAERGLLDFVTLADGVTPQPGDGVRGRLDAVLLAARIAPATRRVGILPTVDTARTEPFLVSTQIATLDFVSRGRAGLVAQVPADRAGDRHVGPRRVSAPEERLDEAREYVDVVRRLWDSWEDGAEIRDASTHRFLDPAKVHRVHFEGAHFSVVGPSITPRSPQGRPPVAAEVDVAADIAFASGPAEHAYVDVVVLLDADRAAAEERRARLDALAPGPPAFVGTPAELADALLDWGAPGYRLHPATRPHDLLQVTRALVPELQARGAFRRAYADGTLRERLGLTRPASRYAAR